MVWILVGSGVRERVCECNKGFDGGFGAWNWRRTLRQWVNNLFTLCLFVRRGRELIGVEVGGEFVEC